MSLPIIDPEFRDLLPPLAADEFAKLEANILKDGCTTPIVLWQGLIADGQMGDIYSQPIQVTALKH